MCQFSSKIEGRDSKHASNFAVVVAPALSSLRLTVSPSLSSAGTLSASSLSFQGRHLHFETILSSARLVAYNLQHSLVTSHNIPFTRRRTLRTKTPGPEPESISNLSKTPIRRALPTPNSQNAVCSSPSLRIWLVQIACVTADNTRTTQYRHRPHAHSVHNLDEIPSTLLLRLPHPTWLPFHPPPANPALHMAPL